MAEEERERRADALAGESYVILRFDGLLVHTKPITKREAWWLLVDMYYGVRDRAARIRYLAEWGNVMDVGEYLERLSGLKLNVCSDVAGIYEGPEKFEERVGRLLACGSLPPKARQTLRELLGKIEEFAREPVEPEPLLSPARYFEAPSIYLAPGPGGVARAEPEWHAYAGDLHVARGVSVFKDSFWLWRWSLRFINIGGLARAVVVRRDADDEDVAAALASDEAAAALLREDAKRFGDVISKYEEELRGRGYGDVARRAREILALAASLGAGGPRAGSRAA